MLNTAIALLLAAAATQEAPAPTASCVYVALPTADEQTPALEPHPMCGALDANGVFRFTAATLANLDRDSRGLGAVFVVDDGWYYVTASGSSAKVLSSDNGPDPFSDGLVRASRNGKIAYLSESLEVVIPPIYDFAWPFENGRALVCSGCSTGSPDEDGHTPVVGGLWGYIDRAGREVVPVRHTQDELRQLDGDTREAPPGAV
jgi:hypothetical protein